MNKINIILILLVLILVLSCILIVVNNTNILGFTNVPFEIVIARYQENLDWVDEIPKELYNHITIYNKGDDMKNTIPNSTLIKLPNYGRESHTYLYHVINNYNNLADVTLFLPGSVHSREDKWKRYEQVIKELNNSKTSTLVCSEIENIINDSYNFNINNWVVTNAENRTKNSNTELTPANIRPYGKWFEAKFPNEVMSCISFTGIIAVTKEDILKRPKKFYIDLLNEHLFENAEVVHYSERSWKNIFSISDENIL